MKFSHTALNLAASLVIAGVSPDCANARPPKVGSQQASNVQATADLTARIEATKKRIDTGMRVGAMSRTTWSTLRKKVTETRTSMTRLFRQQGFVRRLNFLHTIEL